MLKDLLSVLQSEGDSETLELFENEVFEDQFMKNATPYKFDDISKSVSFFL